MDLMGVYETYLIEVKGASENTITSYLRDVRHFQQWLDQNWQVSLSCVDCGLVQQYLHHLQSAGRSSGTVSHVLSSLRTFYTYLVQQGLRQDNPVLPIKVVREEAPIPEILTPQEVQMILAQPSDQEPKGIRDRAMLEIMCATGMRVSELVGLDVQDVNLEAGILLCRGIRKTRTVPLYPRAVKMLKQYLSQVRNSLAKSPEEALFVNVAGRRMSRQGFWKLLKGYQQKAGITKEVTPHILRHSFAVRLLENGTDVLDLKELMGHQDISSTLRYAQLLERDRE